MKQHVPCWKVSNHLTYKLAIESINMWAWEHSILLNRYSQHGRAERDLMEGSKCVCVLRKSVLLFGSNNYAALTVIICRILWYLRSKVFVYLSSFFFWQMVCSQLKSWNEKPAFAHVWARSSTEPLWVVEDEVRGFYVPPLQHQHQHQWSCGSYGTELVTWLSHPREVRWSHVADL